MRLHSTKCSVNSREVSKYWNRQALMTSTDTQRNRPSYANNLKLLVDESIVPDFFLTTCVVIFILSAVIRVAGIHRKCHT